MLITEYDYFDYFVMHMHSTMGTAGLRAHLVESQGVSISNNNMHVHLKEMVQTIVNVYVSKFLRVISTTLLIYRRSQILIIDQRMTENYLLIDFSEIEHVT